MENRNAQQNETADREIVIQRVINAPRELVFEAWTDPEHIGEWWGPTGFTITTYEMEVRPGGTWRYMMHGPDGVDYPNWTKFEEVVKRERLVYTHGGHRMGDDPSNFHVTVTFENENGKTKLTMRSVFQTAEARNHVVKEYKAIEGGNQNMDRLEKYLANKMK